MSLSDLSPVIIVTALVWLVTQTLKWQISRRRNPAAKFSDTGGMPSAHAAVITSAVVVLALHSGINSDGFALAVVVATIVLHDAYRTRWSVGVQAERLNELIKRQGAKGLQPVTVYRGHRGREVIAGVIFGGVLAALLNYLLYP